MSADDERNKPVDILQAFRTKNRGPRLPDPQACHRFASIDNTPSMDHDPDVSNADKEDDNTDIKPMLKKHAWRQMKEPNPQSLEYYPSGWKSILVQAKLNWQYYIAVRNPFPNHEEYLDRAAEILTKTISEYEAKEGILEDGLIIFLSLVLYANYFVGFDQDHNMNILVSVSVLLNHVQCLP